MVTLLKPNPFVSMKHSRTEKSPSIKSKTRPGPKKKKTNEFHSDRRQNLAESDKGSWFNQPSDSEVDSASSLDVPGVSRKKIMTVKKAEHNNVTGATSRNKPGSFLIVGS